MTAPVGQRVRCIVFGHDWRRAIGPRDGFYLRCRRCWVSRQEEEREATQDGEPWSPSGAAQRHA
jgi:hypothetical protein